MHEGLTVAAAFSAAAFLDERFFSLRDFGAEPVEVSRNPYGMCTYTNGNVTSLECALTELLDLKPIRMCTYRKRAGGGQELSFT